MNLSYFLHTLAWTFHQRLVVLSSIGSTPLPFHRGGHRIRPRPWLHFMQMFLSPDPSSPLMSPWQSKKLSLKKRQRRSKAYTKSRRGIEEKEIIGFAHDFVINIRRSGKTHPRFEISLGLSSSSPSTLWLSDEDWV